MFSRRQFLRQGVLSMLGAAGTALALPGKEDRETLPDGSASRGMITPETETAIERGLAYLARSQDREGAFGTGHYQNNVAVTSLAAMAFMAGGHLPGRGSFGRVVTRALEFVLAQGDQRGTTSPLHPAGFLHNSIGPYQHGPMYGHGFGTLFLAELYGMVSDPSLRERLRRVLPRAVQVILNAQNHEGGWRYTPQPRDADISVTICQIMALRSARNAGFFVPKARVDKCVAYVKACQNPAGWFVYQRTNLRGFPMNNQAFARTAAGVCALYSAGLYHGREIEAGLRYLLSNPPSGTRHYPLDMHYFYGHYYAVQAMWTAGGEYWAKWFPAIREELRERQRKPEGCWFDVNCNHYGTAMACIILQVPNNYLPILQK
jgi:hypothetical protein